MPNVLFVNSGILGQRTFAAFVQRELVGERDGIRARQIVLADGLTVGERAVRRLLCTRLWPDGAAGLYNLDLYRFRAELNAGLVARRRIRRLERCGERFDVLHFHRQATAFASLARMRRTPAIVSIDCTQGYLVGRARSAAEARSYLPNAWRERRIFDAARLIVSTSRWAADALRAEHPGCETEIVVMPNPVLLDHFDPGWAAERHARASVDGYLPRVLFVGGEFGRKGGPDLLEAWVRGGFAGRARLELVTSVPPPGSDAPGVTVHTGVRAHSPEWAALWRGADVFALPTHDEAFGTVFQEAAAAGLPAVGTGITAIPEVVADGETGILVEPGDRAALAGALDRLLASAELRREMGERARRRIEATAAPGLYRERLAGAIRRLAEG
ncbi:MAG: glycosyltransferase family 4 protein [Longimicrobiaceae bacterium]